MANKLSTRSLKRLESVHPKLRKVVMRANELFNDFQVASEVADYPVNESTGYAHSVNVIVMRLGKGVYALDAYDGVYTAMREAAQEMDTQIEWCGAEDIRECSDPAEVYNRCIDACRELDVRPLPEVYRFDLNV